MNKKEYKNIWILIEHKDNEIKKVSLELLAKGKELANKLKVELVAILAGNNVQPLTEELLAYGADRVVYIEDEKLENYTTGTYTRSISELIKEEKPEIVLIGATNNGRDLAPRIAARVNTGLTADCTALDVEEETEHLLMTRPAFGGNLMATIMCTDHRPQMATVRPGVFDKLERNDSNIDKSKVRKMSTNIFEEDQKVKFIKAVRKAKDTVDISDATILIAGGRGMKSAENFKILHELAKEIQAEVCGSRAAVDSGWIDHSLQVGQTGKTVKPNLYIACGISGAIQHVAGMQDSDYIIAINKDSNAPIMQIADLGLVGDLNIIIPELTKTLKINKK